MQNTTNLNLKKPEYTDFADIQDINDNMDALDEAIHDTQNSVATFTSSDVADGSAASWTTVPKVASGETHKSIFAKMSQMFKNIRFLYASAIKNITRSGKTFTATRTDGTTFTFDQQDTTYGLSSTSADGLLRKLDNNTAHYMRGDGTWQTPPDTNTWRGIQNNLTSTSTTDSLAAYQGKVLNEKKLDGKENGSVGWLHKTTIGNSIYLVGFAPAVDVAFTNASSTYTGWYYNTGSIGLSSAGLSGIRTVILQGFSGGGNPIVVNVNSISATTINYYMFLPGKRTITGVRILVIIVAY